MIFLQVLHKHAVVTSAVGHVALFHTDSVAAPNSGACTTTALLLLYYCFTIVALFQTDSVAAPDSGVSMCTFVLGKQVNCAVGHVALCYRAVTNILLHDIE
jgi:hypothetical protein